MATGALRRSALLFSVFLLLCNCTRGPKVFEGRLFDARDRTPVTDFTITVVGKGGVVRREAFQDERGAFALPFERDEAVFSIHSDGYYPICRDNVASCVALPMSRCAALRIKVIDESNMPIPWCSLVFRDESGSMVLVHDAPGSFATFTGTGASGEVYVSCLPRQFLTVLIDHGLTNCHTDAVVDLTSDCDQILTVRLEIEAPCFPRR